jgi:hypothetical protein
MMFFQHVVLHINWPVYILLILHVFLKFEIQIMKGCFLHTTSVSTTLNNIDVISRSLPTYMYICRWEMILEVKFFFIWEHVKARDICIHEWWANILSLILGNNPIKKVQRWRRISSLHSFNSYMWCTVAVGEGHIAPICSLAFLNATLEQRYSFCGSLSLGFVVSTWTHLQPIGSFGFMQLRPRALCHSWVWTYTHPMWCSRWQKTGAKSLGRLALLENHDQINKQSTDLCWLVHCNDRFHWFCNFYKNQHIDVYFFCWFV